ncbi:hypothetical protein F5J12DRAFT_831438, partial [Pisolithus orientalis]|uniref:uncharacterized protein n=1 Tax=Pisolithus orientalis TaxID=936130 RepID=UPI0022253DBB
MCPNTSVLVVYTLVVLLVTAWFPVYTYIAPAPWWCTTVQRPYYRVLDSPDVYLRVLVLRMAERREKNKWQDTHVQRKRAPQHHSKWVLVSTCHNAVAIYTILNIRNLLFRMLARSAGRVVMRVEDPILLYC